MAPMKRAGIASMDRAHGLVRAGSLNQDF